MATIETKRIEDSGTLLGPLNLNFKGAKYITKGRKKIKNVMILFFFRNTHTAFKFNFPSINPKVQINL
ncbi:hypothetical protein N9B59_01290 [Flavobacteriales bacterium]|nr:hypothetical protein [Flavobacteriales bacterium]